MGFWAFSKNGHPKSASRNEVDEKKKKKKKGKRDGSPVVTHSNGSTVKVSKKHEIGKRRDIISDLPISILHRILAFLSPRDVARTSALSKQWNFTRKSFPRLIFPEGCGFIISEERRGELVDYVDRSLQCFVQHKLCIERLRLNLRHEVSDYFPVVDTWLPLALHHGASEISFRVFSYSYALPQTTFVVNSSSTLDGSSEFFRLRKLTLSGFLLSENIVCDMIRNCPNLVDLVLVFVCGLETLNISARKLKTLSIEGGEELSNICVDAPSLVCFELDATLNRIAIDLTSCYNMRGIVLDNLLINDDLFHLHLSCFPLLEVLDISQCHLLRRIRISHQRLQYLRIECCCGIEDIEIDAPILLKFELQPVLGADLPRFVSRNTVRGSVELGYVLDINGGGVNTRFFLVIREFLSRVRSDAIYVLSESQFYELDELGDPSEVSFDIEELRQAVIPPLVEVDCLNFHNIHMERCPALIRGLIWSCHPKKVKMCNNYGNCIKVFCLMVLQTKCLKAANIESVGGRTELNIKSTGGIERKQFRRLLRNLHNHLLIPKDSYIVFKLEWDHSAIQRLVLF